MSVTRREAVAGLLLPAAAALTDSVANAARSFRRATPFKKGITRINLDPDASVEECCRVAKLLGARGIDFINDPRDWPTLKRYGLTCSLYRVDANGGSSTVKPPPGGGPGWGTIGLAEAQGAYLDACHRGIDLAAAHGFPNMVMFAGTRDTISYAEGADNAVAFLSKLSAHAERSGVTLCMELLNSLSHIAPPKSLFDHVAWGWDVLHRVNSPRVKMLFDVFHVQLMDGNIVETITNNIGLIGHFHMSGVPGRHELTDNEELNYRTIGRAIAATGFDGFVTMEYDPSPGGDPIAKLRRSIDLIEG